MGLKVLRIVPSSLPPCIQIRLSHGTVPLVAEIMIPLGVDAHHPSDDRSAFYPEKGMDPPPTPHAAKFPPTRAMTRQRLHEPFVSPEFVDGSERTLRIDRGGPSVHHAHDEAPRRVGVAGHVRDSSEDEIPGQGLLQVPPPHAQAAPLYTVLAGTADGRTLPASISSLPDSLLLSKRLAVTAAGRSSVLGPSQVARAVSASGGTEMKTSGRELDFLSNLKGNAPRISNQREEDTTAKSLLTSPEDLLPAIIEATCSWGQELTAILGKDVLNSRRTSDDEVKISPVDKSGLITTGLFPQTMQLRCDRCCTCRDGQLRLTRWEAIMTRKDARPANTRSSNTVLFILGPKCTNIQRLPHGIDMFPACVL